MCYISLVAEYYNTNFPAGTTFREFKKQRETFPIMI
jgi:hypothetical protein